jgi:site-specific DNA recombinase
MRAAVYARKSSDNEAGVSRQVDLARDFIASQGWTLDEAHVYTDNDISGATFTRPGLDALKLAVMTQPRPFDVLVMMDASRLGRDMEETLPLQGRITRAGVRIFHYQDGQELLLSTPVQKLVASVANFSHEDFRYQIKLKTTDALRKKAQQGHATGSRLLGYKNISQGVGLGKSGKDSHTHVILEIDPEGAALVRRIYQDAADGKGCHSIAVALSDEQIPPPGAGSGWRKKSKTPTAWSVSTIRKILTRSTYRGRIVRGTQTIEAPHLRIIDEPLWQKVQKRLARARDHFAPHRASDGTLTGRPEVGAVGKRLLSGLLQCAACGSAMVAVSRYNKDGKCRLYWACNRAYKGTAGCSVKKVMPDGKLESAILYHFEGLTPQVIEGLLQEELSRLLVEDSGKVSARERLQAEVTRLDDELGRLAAAIAEGGQMPALIALMQEKQRQRTEASARLEHLQGISQDDPDGSRWLERMRPLVQLQLAGNLKDALSGVPSGRQMLRSILVSPIRLTWDGASWTYEGEVHLGRLIGGQNVPLPLKGDMAAHEYLARVTSGHSPSRGGRVTPPGTSTQGRSRSAASAIIMAGRPLSQVATPITPRRVGSERASRRSTTAASLR